MCILNSNLSVGPQLVPWTCTKQTHKQVLSHAHKDNASCTVGHSTREALKELTSDPSAQQMCLSPFLYLLLFMRALHLCAQRSR